MQNLLQRIKQFYTDPSLNKFRKVFVFIVGMTVLLLGLIMVVLPGPALLFLPLGLAILATEFVWAKKLKDRFKKQLQALKKEIKK